MALVQKAFSDIITFSRSSNATRVGPTGLVEYAPHNLILQSQTFDNASWVKDQVSISANSAAAPNGTVTAETWTENTVSDYHGIAQSISTTANSVYTVSVYAKYISRKYLILSVWGTFTAYASVIFDIETGAIANSGASGTGYSVNSASITAVGNGWYRCVMTFTVGSTAATQWYVAGAASATIVGYGLNSYLGSSQQFYLWGAQLSVGPYALDYTPTTSAAVYGPRFDYDGSGVTIVEPVSRNLLTYSQSFGDASWIVSNATKTSTTATDPNGGSTALTLTKTANDNYSLRKTTGINPAGQTYAISVYLKGSGTCVLLMDNNVDQDLVNQTITLTSTWTRYAFSGTANATSGNLAAAIRLGAGSATSLDIAFFQIEVGSTATAYMVSGATNGFRAVPVVSGSATARGLLVEEQRTNLATYSESFNAGGWSGDGGNTVVLNSTTSPDGTVNAAKISFSSTTYRYLGITTVVSSVYTLSVFVKLGAGGNNQIQLEGAGTATVFNLSSGTVVSSTATSSSITSFGNGWYRCSCTFSASSTTTFIAFNMLGTFTSGQGHFFWGGQFELGSFATSYIPTVGSTVTRSADVPTVNTLSPWYNATEGTLFSEFDVVGKTPLTTQTVVALTDALAANYALLYKSPSGNNEFGIISGGVSQANLVFSSPVVNTTYKLAGAYKANDFAAVENGGTVATDTSGSVPSSVSYFGLGYLISGFPLQLNGHLRRVAYYPRRLTNAELQALTA